MTDADMKAAARARVGELVQSFVRNEADYLRVAYNETQARTHGNASRDAFEEALGCPVLDEFTLYREAEERSKRRCGLL